VRGAEDRRQRGVVARFRRSSNARAAAITKYSASAWACIGTMPSIAATRPISSSTALSRCGASSASFSRSHYISSRIACCNSTFEWNRKTSFHSGQMRVSGSMLLR
jgi:hypothetical protein